MSQSTKKPKMKIYLPQEGKKRGKTFKGQQLLFNTGLLY